MFQSILYFLFYAIISHNEKKPDTDNKFNYTLPYFVFRTQYSENGNYSHDLAVNNKQITFTGSSFWYQDDDEKFLSYKKDNATVRCIEDPLVGYEEYIHQLSLTDMYNRHSERRQMRGDTEVYVFESDPVRWKHENVVPYLTQAYAANDGRLMEFHSYYSQKENNGWRSLSYQFYDMKLDKPPEEILEGLPGSCEVSSTKKPPL